MAVFKVHLDAVDASSVEVSKLMEWIYSLNPNIGLELCGVFQTHSTDLIVHAPWEIWAALNGLSGFHFIYETFGHNRLPDFRRPGTDISQRQ